MELVNSEERGEKINNLRYDGIYHMKFSENDGIYLRFHRKGIVTHAILPSRIVNEGLFNLLEKNYHNNIGTAKYTTNESDATINFSLDTEKLGNLKVVGKIENGGTIILSIYNTIANKKILNEIKFEYYKKYYSNLKYSPETKDRIREKQEEIKNKTFNCTYCGGRNFEIYIADEFIAFMCKKCKTIFSYENNEIEILKKGVKKPKAEVKQKNTNSNSRPWDREPKYKGGWDPDPLEE
jgi:hypothetical protein